MAILILETGHGPALLGHIGTVEDVIKAHLPPEVTSKRVKAADFSMGFELATPKELTSIGDSVLVNDICYATSTDSKSPEYNRTISGSDFISGGMFLIPKEAKPSHRVQVNERISMIDFYNALYKKIGRPLAFGGIFHFAELHAIAIGKAPLDGHNIFTYKQEYYPHPAIEKQNVYGFAMGAMTNFQGYPEINEQLQTVLYKNPMDAQSLLTHHAHILVLKKKVKELKEIVPAVVDLTLHLFIDRTVLLSGEVEVFTVAGVRNLLHGKTNP